MSSSRLRRSIGFVVGRLRVLGLGRNVLRRRVDRIEALVVVGALAVAVVVVPAGVALGAAIRDHAEQSAATRRAELHEVQARTVKGAADAVPASPSLITTTVPIEWVDDSGSSHQAQAAVLIGTKAGSELTIWLDQNGNLVTPPDRPGDGTAAGFAAGSTMASLAWSLLYALFRLTRRSLDRRRAALWAREWEDVARRWTQPRS